MNEMMDMIRELEALGLNEEMLVMAGGIVLVVFLIVGMINVGLYIFRAAGIYTIAKRRGIRHAWLAWLPVAYYWTAGSISDQYKTSVKGKSSCNRIILLVLAIVGGVVSLAVSGMTLGVVAEMFEYLADGDLQGLAYAGTLATGSSELLSLLYDVLDLALVIFWHISLYDIYSSACPQNKVAFLVLGIIFPVTVPFFLFYNRKKDEGMRIPQPEGDIPPADTATEYL